MKKFYLLLVVIGVLTNSSIYSQCTVVIDHNSSSCYGMCTGWASAYATGVPPFTYQWSNQNNMSDLTEICPGTYSVTITDNIGCTATDVFTLGEYPMFTAQIDSTKSERCWGDSTGEAWMSVNGGVPPYTYNWNFNGNNGPHATGLTTYMYYPVVTDSVGCSTSAFFELWGPSPVQINENIVQTPCFTTYGYVTLTVYGGTPAGGANPIYNYLWGGGETESFIDTLSSGIFYVTVTDSLGCSASKAIVVNTSDGPQPQVYWSNVLCHGQNSGNVYSASNNTPFNSCSWHDSNNSTILQGVDFTTLPTNLYAGDYWLEVITPLGCKGYNYFTITEPTPMVNSGYQINNLCFGDTAGSVYLNISGGSPIQTGFIYNYNWSNGSVADSIVNLGAGIYSVTVTDFYSCEYIEAFEIMAPALLFVDSFLVTDVSCNGFNDGFVSVYISGGTFPYYYSLDSASWDVNYNINTPVGNNNHVIIKDANYCYTNTPYFSITEPSSPLEFTFIQNDPSCVGNDGAIDITPTGGTPPYNIQWDTPLTGFNVSGLSQGSYNTTITDAHSCESLMMYDLVQTGELPVISGINMYGGSNTLPPNEAEIYLFKPSIIGASAMDTVAQTINSTSLWEFNGLQPGQYFVKADLINPSNFPTLLNTYYDTTYKWQNAVPIVLYCNDTANIVINMVEMTPQTTGNGCLSGTILMLTGNKSTKAAGEPVPGAEILIEQEPNDIPVQCAISDSLGKYEFTGLNPGSGYHLIVDIPGFPLLSTYQNINVLANDTIPNLNFLVDSTTGGGIFIDTASFVSYIPNEGVFVEVYPNPFKSVFNVKFELNESKNVFIELFDALGRKVETIDAGYLNPGRHDILINPKEIDGSCFLLIHAGNSVLMKKLIAKP